MRLQELETIQSVAAATGVTSRTLRHYDDIGLLTPAGTGSGGVRLYSEHDLVRLQAILVMRELGLPLDDIAKALKTPNSVHSVLESHLQKLEEKSQLLNRMIAATQRTLANTLKGKATKMAEMFDGFDHTQHREEVEQRWGKKAYLDSDKWWRSLSEKDRAEWKKLQDDLLADWRVTASSGVSPESQEAQALARRQEEWLAAIPGTPGYGSGEVPAQYLLGLAEMYVADERFAANYGGAAGAEFVRDAIKIWVASR